MHTNERNWGIGGEQKEKIGPISHVDVRFIFYRQCSFKSLCLEIPLDVHIKFPP